MKKSQERISEIENNFANPQLSATVPAPVKLKGWKRFTRWVAGLFKSMGNRFFLKGDSNISPADITLTILLLVILLLVLLL